MYYDYEKYNVEEKQTFRPSLIPRQLPDVVEIIGPRSIGKTTTANMISIGGGGIDNEDIHFVIQRKLRLLMEPNYQEFTFRYELKSFDGNFTFTAEKSDSKSPLIDKTIDDNGEISKDFEKKCVLIHVTPMAPNTIIDPMKQEVEEAQGKIIKKLNLLMLAIREAINSSSNVRNEIIKEKKKENESLREKLKLCSIKINLSLDKLRLLMSATSRMGLKLSERTIKEILSEITKLEKKIGPKINKVGHNNKEFNMKQKEIKEKLTKLRSQIEQTTMQLMSIFNDPDDQDNLDKWQKISFDNAETELTIDKNFGKLINDFQLEIQKMRDDNKDTIDEVEYYTQVRKALSEDCGFLDANFAGLDITISVLIGAINKLLESHKKLMSNIPIMESCTKNLRELKSKMAELEGLFQKFKQLRESVGEDIKETSNIEENRKKMESYKEELEFWKNEKKNYLDIKNQGIKLFNGDFDNRNCEIGKGDLIEYKETGPEGLLKAIETVKNQINTFTADKEIIEDAIKRNDDEIQTKENEKPLEWEGCYEELNTLLQDIRYILGKFKEMDNYIGDLDKYNEIENIKDDRLIYYDVLFSYFAKIRPHIVHNRKKYEVVRIDPNGFTDKNNVMIKFDDMGGSEGQSAFLDNTLSMLDISGDNRKIIFLVDEVGNIDADDLEKLREKMRRLRKENRLLFGAIIRVQTDHKKINGPPDIIDLMDVDKIWKD